MNCVFQKQSLHLRKRQTKQFHGHIQGTVCFTMINLLVTKKAIRSLKTSHYRQSFPHRYLKGGSRFLRNVGQFIPDYTNLHQKDGKRKGKDFTVHDMKAYVGVEEQLHSLKAGYQMVVSCWLNVTGNAPPAKDSKCKDCIQSCVETRGSLDVLEESKISCLYRESKHGSSAIQHVAQ